MLSKTAPHAALWHIPIDSAEIEFMHPHARQAEKEHIVDGINRYA